MSTDTVRNYEEFGRDLASRGDPTLRFGDDGRYRINDREVDLKGVRLVACMHTLRTGWVRWDSGFPVEEIMGKVSEGFQPPARHELGYDDKSLWDTTSKDGWDPWRPTFDIIVIPDDDCCNYLRFVIDRDYYAIWQQDNDHPTGAESLGVLAQVYAARMRAGQSENDLPLIELKHRSFTGGRPVATYYAPQINVIGLQSEAIEAAQAAPPKVVKLPAKRRAAK